MQLVQLLVAQDTDGRNKEQEGDKFGVWAEISNPSGFRSYANGQTVMGNTKNFLIRFKINKYPDCNWKIRYEGKDWTITNIEKVDEKRFYWRMTATAKSDV
ncbi:MAG: phage head closure protein [Chitinophagaceae bacterium]|nr:phage head closure protein [Chitinophagaceae bacterium]